MNSLFVRMKQAHRADKEKPGVFGDYLDEFRGAWLKAIGEGKIRKKFARSVANWAITQDLLEVVQWFEKYLMPVWPRANHDKFDHEFLYLTMTSGAETVLRWAEDRLPPTCSIYAFEPCIVKAAETGKIGLLEWVSRWPIEAKQWQAGLMAAARANQLQACRWLTLRGAVIDSRIYVPLLEGGHVDFLRKLPKFPGWDIANLHRVATKAGQIPSLEWLRERCGPEFDPLIVIAEAVRYKHLHVLRWLHEECKVPAESFRRLVNDSGELQARPSLCDSICAHSLEITKWLQKVCCFTKADLVAESPGGFIFKQIGRNYCTRSTKELDWLQATFRFTTEEMCVGGITQTNTARDDFCRFVYDSQLARWLIRTFDFTFEDLTMTFVFRWAKSSDTDSLGVLQLAHERIPGGLPLASLLPEDAAILTNAVSNAAKLEWFHSIGLRTTDPRCAQDAIKYRSSGMLKVLHDLFGITSIGTMPAICYHLGENMLEVLHDCYGFRVADLRQIGWKRVDLTSPGVIRVCLDKYGATPRELWTALISDGRNGVHHLIDFRHLLGMTAKDWRARDYQLLRPLVAWGGVFAEGRMNKLHKIFDVFGLTAQDALALSRSPDIADTPRISLQRLAKKLKEISRHPARPRRACRA